MDAAKQQKVFQCIATTLAIPMEQVTLNMAIGSIPQWDSIMQLRLVMEIESEYGISIPIDIVPELDTLHKFYDQIKDSKE